MVNTIFMTQNNVISILFHWFLSYKPYLLMHIILNNVLYIIVLLSLEDQHYVFYRDDCVRVLSESLFTSTKNNFTYTPLNVWFIKCTVYIWWVSVLTWFYCLFLSLSIPNRVFKFSNLFFLLRANLNFNC